MSARAAQEALHLCSNWGCQQLSALHAVDAWLDAEINRFILEAMCRRRMIVVPSLSTVLIHMQPQEIDEDGHELLILSDIVLGVIVNVRVPGLMQGFQDDTVN